MSEAPTTTPRRPVAQRLREVAKELFYRQGIRATGVEELCRVAGTTKIGLYRAFPSKDALVAAILQDDCQDMACWYETVTGTGVPPRERPAAFLARAAGQLRKPGFRGCALGLAIAEFPDPEHPARQVADAHKRKVRAFLRQICAEAGATEPEDLGDALLLLVEGAFSAVAYLGNEEAARSLERAGRILLEAALPPRPAS